MRVEEMYFIEAEAAAHLDAAQGVALLTDFMKKYRDPNYVCPVSSTDDVVEEIAGRHLSRVTNYNQLLCSVYCPNSILREYL